MGSGDGLDAGGGGTGSGDGRPSGHRAAAALDTALDSLDSVVESAAREVEAAVGDLLLDLTSEEGVDGPPQGGPRALSDPAESGEIWAQP
mmetsp:Transcript_49066/g.111297  ORF Transcript_49066/g.111297 Transcript_49066/m.111297 type:complete len:90 (-) Transcript_49066:131-400(-)